MTYLLLILILIIVVEGYVIYNLLFKVEKYETTILTQTQILNSLYNVIYDMNLKLKEIDDRGTFESDDEVGFFFSELKQMQSTLNQYIESNVSKEEKTG